MPTTTERRPRRCLRRGATAPRRQTDHQIPRRRPLSREPRPSPTAQIYASPPSLPGDQASPQAATMYRRLLKEHVLLQRSYDLLQQSASSHQGWKAERQELEAKVRLLDSQVESLRQELTEARDQAELLEFCVLELQTEPQPHGASSQPASPRRRPCEMDQNKIVSELQNLYDSPTLEEKHKKLVRQLLTFFLGKGTYSDCCSQVPMMVEHTLHLYEKYTTAREQVQNLISVGSGPSEPGSEDEGLGEEGRNVSGPASLADLQEHPSWDQGLREKFNLKDARIAKLEEELLQCKDLKAKCSHMESTKRQLEERVAQQEKEHEETNKRLEENCSQLKGVITNLEKQLEDCRQRLEVQTKSSDATKKLEALKLELTYKDEIVKTYEEHFKQIKCSPSKIPIKLSSSGSPLRNFASKISFSHGNLSKIGLTDDRLVPLEIRIKESKTKEDDPKRSKSNFSLHPQRWFKKKTKNPEKIQIEQNNADISKTYQNSIFQRRKEVEHVLPNIDGGKLSLPPKQRQASERSLKDKLLTLEKNNREFEKDLETRDRICKQKEVQHKKFSEIESKLKESIKRLEAEKTALTRRTSELTVEKTRLQDQLEKLKLGTNSAAQNYRQNCETLNLKHSLIQKTLQMKIKSLENQQSEIIQKITNFDNEKADLPPSSKNQQEKSSITPNTLKNEQNELQNEIISQKNEIKQNEVDFRSKFNTLEKNYSNEVKTLQKEMDGLKNREIELQNQITKLNSREIHLSEQLKAKERELSEIKQSYEKKIKALEEEYKVVEADLQWKLKQIEETAEETVKSMEEERKALEKNVKEDMKDLKSKEYAYKSKIAELENSVKDLHNEIHQLSSEPWNNSSEKTLKQKLIEYESREKYLKQKLEENEKKEEAYKETLVHAEKLVQSQEQRYKEKVEEMENASQSLKRKVVQLEQSEQKLLTILHEERRLADGRKSGELVNELLEADSRESALREKIEETKSQNRILNNKIRDLERSQSSLQEELLQKDDLIQIVEKLKADNAELKKDLNSVSQAKSILQEALQETESIFSQRNDDMALRISTLEKERKELKDTIYHLRTQIQELKLLLEKHEEERISSEVASHLLSIHRRPLDDPQEAPRRHPMSSKSCQNLSSPTTQLYSEPATSDTSDDGPDDGDNNYRTYIKKSCKGSPTPACTTSPPPPQDFRVLRQVGEDGLLVGWRPPATSTGATPACFKLYVNGELQHTTRSPDRTKALLHKLDLARPCHLAIYSVSVSGLRSAPVVLHHGQDSPPGSTKSSE